MLWSNSWISLCKKWSFPAIYFHFLLTEIWIGFMKAHYLAIYLVCESRFGSKLSFQVCYWTSLILKTFHLKNIHEGFFDTKPPRFSSKNIPFKRRNEKLGKKIKRKKKYWIARIPWENRNGSKFIVFITIMNTPIFFVYLSLSSILFHVWFAPCQEITSTLNIIWPTIIKNWWYPVLLTH